MYPPGRGRGRGPPPGYYNRGPPRQRPPQQHYSGPTFTLLINNQQYGPYPLPAIEEEIKAMRVFFTCQVLDANSRTWVPAMNVPELAELFMKYQEVQLLELPTVRSKGKTLILTSRKLVILPGKMEKTTDGIMRAFGAGGGGGGPSPTFILPNNLQRIQADSDSTAKGEFVKTTFFYPGTVGVETTEISFSKANANLLLESLEGHNWNFEFVDHRVATGATTSGSVSQQPVVIQNIHYGDVVSGDKSQSSSVNIQDSVVTGSTINEPSGFGGGGEVNVNIQDSVVQNSQIGTDQDLMDLMEPGPAASSCPVCNMAIQPDWQVCPSCASPLR